MRTLELREPDLAVPGPGCDIHVSLHTLLVTDQECLEDLNIVGVPHSEEFDKDV